MEALHWRVIIAITTDGHFTLHYAETSPTLRRHFADSDTLLFTPFRFLALSRFFAFSSIANCNQVANFLKNSFLLSSF